MHMLQKSQKTMSSFQKVWAARLSLIIIPVLLLCVFASFLGETGTASAASVAATHRSSSISRSTGLRPQTSGGGCQSNAFIESCISIDVWDIVIPDAYLKTSGCNIDVALYENGNFVDDASYSGCYSAGAYFTGPTEYNAPSVTWQTFAVAKSNGVGQWSRVQYS